jgi:hypothetical protein
MSNPARGELLVEMTGIYQQEKMIDNLDVLAWLDQNRRHAARTGCCPGGCMGKQMIPHERHGYAVCPMTYEPCQKRRLSRIIQLLGIVNGQHNDKKRND